MGDRSPFSPQVSAAGRFSEIEVERHQSDAERARSHAIGRNRRVGQVLCYLSVMVSRGLLPRNGQGAVVGAAVQDFSSTEGRQAAHYLPGHLRLAVPGKAPCDLWDLAGSAGVASRIAALFSAVQDLPPNFNKADSYVEQHARPSLKRLFADAANQVLAAAPHQVRGKVNVTAVRSAYQHWIDQSLIAYRAAINRKTDIAELDDLPPATAPRLDGDGRLEPHELNLELIDLQGRALRKGGVTVWDYSEQVRILGHYLTASRSCALTDAMVDEVEGAFRP